jgi:hypothetical protein
MKFHALKLAAGKRKRVGALALIILHRYGR